MNAVPKAIKDAISSSVSVMLASASVPPSVVDGALAALFAELDGVGTKSITNREPLDRLLSRAQAADILGCSKRAVSEKIKSGKIVGIFGGDNRERITGISEASLRAYMRGGCNDGAAVERKEVNA